MRTATEDFLDLVDCLPDEVLDVPADRLGVIHSQFKGTGSPSFVVHFGKHKGCPMSDVPGDYLRWALGENARGKSFRKFQQQAKAELKRRRGVLG